jgi:acetyl-CoA acetyltransferase family protein
MFERTQPVICAGARTPIGRFGGALAPLPAVELGGRAIAAALERAGTDPGAVEHVIMGHVLQAGQGQITARQAAVRGGIPMTVPALTVNKVCLSGLNAIATAAQYVELGQAGLLAAGGMESMSGTPYVVPKARFGARMGDTELVDAMVHDGLWDAFDHAHMGGLSDQVNQRLGIDRAAQDEWSARSHERAAEATKNGVLASEIAPVVIAQRKGEVTVEEDEGIRPGTTAEALGRLRPAFSPDGTITAGNASPLNDGASALLMGSEGAATVIGGDPVARIAGRGASALEPQMFGYAPVEAAEIALRRAGITWSEVDAVELNEAFAVQSLACIDAWGLDPEIVNVRGGAIAIGHPLGASGGRILGTLAKVLREGGHRWGVAAICIGVGQGLAVVLENLGTEERQHRWPPS